MENMNLANDPVPEQPIVWESPRLNSIEQEIPTANRE
jgi:hypothetical protein